MRRSERRTTQSLGPSLRWLSVDPITNSRLGDIGFIDAKGTWKRVLNIFDQGGCERAGMNPLRLAKDVSMCVVRREASNTIFKEPVIQLSPGGKYQLINLKDPDRYDIIQPNSLMNRVHQTGLTETYITSNFGSSTLGFLIFPLPNTTTTAFIAGPEISILSLSIPEHEINAFLKQYRSKIIKSAHKAMETFPPQNSSRIVSLCLTEFITRAWKSIHIQTADNPSPLPMGWKSVQDGGSGRWTVSIVPTAGTTVRGSFGNYHVKSSMETL